MAEEQKPVDVAAKAAETTQNEAPAAVATEAAPATDAAAEDKPAAEEAKPAEEEAKTEEAKPVEEGHLGYKAQGLSFPK